MQQEPMQEARWRKSSFSQYEACVTVAELPGGVGVRDSKQPDGEALVMSRRQFAAWLASVRESDG